MSTEPLKVVKFLEKDIIEMILFPVVNEACRIMEEGHVVKASDIDVASVLAMGFPSYRFISFFIIIITSLTDTLVAHYDMYQGWNRLLG